VIQREIEAPLSQLLIAGEVEPGRLLRARVQGDRPVFDFEP
jgi:hypothetical protein